MDKLILISNLFFVSMAVYGGLTVVKWKRYKGLTSDTKEVIRAWAWIFGSMGVNVGWFFFSRLLSSEGEIWNSTMFQLRGYVICLTALGFGWGMIKFVKAIEGISFKRAAGIFLIIILISSLLGVLKSLA